MESPFRVSMVPKLAHYLQPDYQEIQRVWEIEHMPITTETKFSSDEIECVKPYDQTTTFVAAGRPIVRLPLKLSQSCF